MTPADLFELPVIVLYLQAVGEILVLMGLVILVCVGLYIKLREVFNACIGDVSQPKTNPPAVIHVTNTQVHIPVGMVPVLGDLFVVGDVGDKTV